MSNMEARATVGRSLAMYAVVAAVVVMLGAVAFTVSKKATGALGGPTGPPGPGRRAQTAEQSTSQPGIMPSDWDNIKMAEVPEPGRANDLARERELYGDKVMRDDNPDWAAKAYEAAAAAAEVALKKGRSDEQALAKSTLARVLQKQAVAQARFGEPKEVVATLTKALEAGMDPAMIERGEFERVRAAEPTRYESLRDLVRAMR